MAGWNEGNIITSYSTGIVTGNVTIGGLVGYNNEGSITASYNTGMVVGGSKVGGLVGNNSGKIATSYSSSSVSGEHRVGGLVGLNWSNIATSYSTGTVSGNTGVGGFVGLNSGSITASFNTSTVTGDRNVGGLVGENNDGNITISYSTGMVTGDEYTGGFVGKNGGGIATSFWNTETSGQISSDGGIGLSTAVMQDFNTYLNAGWDFVDETLNGTCDYWQISPGDYPQLFYHPGNNPVMPEGLGTAEQPYLIRDARDLGTVWFEPSVHYRLEESVDLSGIAWSIAVIPFFRGTFDGNGYVISNLHIQGGDVIGNLHIQGGDYLGLFGQLGSQAEISNLGLDAVNVYGSGDYVGGLAGSNGGQITKCYSTGSVRGSRNWGDLYIGGLIGRNLGNMTQCYSTCAVSGYHCVGGIVGSNAGSITTSYNTGEVSGEYDVGGLVGSNWGDITTSYNTGTITGGGGGIGGLVGWNMQGSIIMSHSTGTIISGEHSTSVGGLVGGNRGIITMSFWDIETSGQTTSAGGTCKTTAEMQTASTFLDAGWDFVDEATNGTENIWWIDEGYDYPRLWWEIGDEPSP